MPNTPLISVIIVSWNVADSLKKCLDSVFAAGYPHLEVIVIDNASSDNSLKIAKSFPGIKLIINNTNPGFPHAVNQGLKTATGDYFLLINPDAQIPRNLFTDMLKYYRDYPDTGVVGPKLINPDGTPQGSVFPEPSVISTFRQYWLGREGLTDKYVPAGVDPLAVNSVSGACMFFPKTTLVTVGPFTDKVFMYYEDLDFCRRIRWVGKKVIFHPGISVTHIHGQSSRKNALTQKYIREASVWYNGPLKYYLLTAIIWSSQKWRAIFPSSLPGGQ